MDIGLAIAQIGPFADPTTSSPWPSGPRSRGYASLWALDRLLDPVAPRSAYPATPKARCPASSASPSTRS